MKESVSYESSAISLARRAWLGVALAIASIALTPALSVPGSPFPVPALQAQETGLAVGSKAPATTLVETPAANKSGSATSGRPESVLAMFEKSMAAGKVLALGGIRNEPEGFAPRSRQLGR